MSSSVLSQRGDTPKTPTLSQYAKAKGIEATPHRSFVKIIFKPNQYSGYSLVTGHGFRVSMADDPEKNLAMAECLDQVLQDGSALFVVIEDGVKGWWTLEVSDSETANYEEKSFGYSCTIGRPRSKKDRNVRASTAKMGEES